VAGCLIQALRLQSQPLQMQVIVFNWTEGGVIVSPLSSYTFVVSANRTLVANFTAIQYTVAVSSNPLAGGNTNGSGLYNAGASVTVTATANAGYSFNKWTEGGIQVSTSANYTFVVNNNRTLVANFAIVNAGPDGVNLRSAGDFAVIAGGGISNTGVTTRITGDVGSFPTATINGLLAGNVIGTLYTVADPIVGTAKTDLTTAYNDAQSRFVKCYFVTWTIRWTYIGSRIVRKLFNEWNFRNRSQRNPYT